MACRSELARESGLAANYLFREQARSYTLRLFREQARSYTLCWQP